MVPCQPICLKPGGRTLLTLNPLVLTPNRPTREGRHNEHCITLPQSDTSRPGDEAEELACGGLKARGRRVIHSTPDDSLNPPKSQGSHQCESRKSQGSGYDSARVTTSYHCFPPSSSSMMERSSHYILPPEKGEEATIKALSQS